MNVLQRDKVKEPTAPKGQKYWFRRHPKLTLSAFAIFGCALTIILAEIAARVSFPEWAPNREERVKFWAYDELLGWAHTPDQRGRFKHRDFSVEVGINSQGMRDSEYSIERSEKRRMLVVGDSFGWGFGVELHERFSEILENAHPDWEIINASVSGYGSDQQFLFLEKRGMVFKPDVVLLLFSENDFENNIRAEEYWYFKPFFAIEDGRVKLRNVPVPKATSRQRIDRFFLGRTYLGQKFYFHLFKLFARNKKGNNAKNSEDEKRTWDVTSHLLTGLDELCKKNGSLFILVSIPMNSDKRAFLQKIAENRKIPYFPLDVPFESTGTSVMFPHDQHWNPKGHEIAAEALDAFLWGSGVIGSN